MERSLLGSVFVLGCLSCLYCLLATRRPPKDAKALLGALPRAHSLLAFSLPFLVFIVTLPAKPPWFAAGHGFGLGFFLGGIGALFAAFLSHRALTGVSASPHGDGATAALVAPWSVALILASAPLLWMRPTLLDALLGIAIGWLVLTFVVLNGLRADKSEGSISNALFLPLLSGVGYLITICAVAALGEMRGSVAVVAAKNKVAWSALGLAFSAALPLILLFSGSVSALLGRIGVKLPLAGYLLRLCEPLFPISETRQKGGGRLLIGVLALLGFSRWLSGRVTGQPQLFLLLTIGLATGILLWWVIGANRRQEDVGKNGDFVGKNGLLGFILLVGLTLSYQILAGFGVGLCLIAAWLACGFAVIQALESRLDSSSIPNVEYAAQNLTRFLLFGVGLLLYRLTFSRFETELRGVNLTDHYAILGFLLGALIPGALYSFLHSGRAAGSAPRLLMTGALALLIPAGALLLWGEKSAIALLIGLALSQALSDSSEDRDRALISLLALAVGLALAQWANHILPHSLLSRADKARILTWAVGVTIAALLVTDYGTRFADWLSRRRQQSLSAGQGGAA